MTPSMFTNTEEGDTAPTSGIRPHQPDKYYGQRDFLLLGNWIFSVDQYFILTDMPIYKQGPFISTLLRDEALLWYRANYENWHPAVPLTWPTIRRPMHEYFAPPNEDRRLQDEWVNLKQFGTVFEYVSVLTALAMQIPSLSQTQVLDKFIRGLKPNTRIEVELRDPKTPEEAYRLADRFDRIVYGAKSTTFLTQNYNRYSSMLTTSYGEPMQIDTLRPRRFKPKDIQRLRVQGLCFNCQKPGHIAVNCPTNYTTRKAKSQLGKGRQQ